MKMVTRTMTTTHYEVMGMNTETAEVIQRVFDYAGTAMSEKKTLSKINADTPENETYVKVVSVREETMLYGMTEEDFMKYAQPLPEEQAKRESYNK